MKVAVSPDGLNINPKSLDDAPPTKLYEALKTAPAFKFKNQFLLTVEDASSKHCAVPHLRLCDHPVGQIHDKFSTKTGKNAALEGN